jgi:hypothetical protein
MEFLTCALVTGRGATLVIDAWAIVRRRLFGTALPNYAMVGRWLALVALRGQVRQASMTWAPSVRGELAIGWIAHYLIGIGFASILLLAFGIEWICAPALLPALTVGIGTVAAPFLIMQPAMGAGVAASRTPRPAAARRQSLVTHAIFGVGLYVAGWVAHLWFVP